MYLPSARAQISNRRWLNGKSCKLWNAILSLHLCSRPFATQSISKFPNTIIVTRYPWLSSGPIYIYTYQNSRIVCHSIRGANSRCRTFQCTQFHLRIFPNREELDSSRHWEASYLRRSRRRDALALSRFRTWSELQPHILNGDPMSLAEFALKRIECTTGQ